MNISALDKHAATTAVVILVSVSSHGLMNPMTFLMWMISLDFVVHFPFKIHLLVTEK